MKKERLHISKALPGMILSAPVVSPNKITLFQIGTILTRQKINAIRKYNVTYIAIYDDIQSALDDNIITLDQVEEIKSLKENNKRQENSKEEKSKQEDSNQENEKQGNLNQGVSESTEVILKPEAGEDSDKESPPETPIQTVASEKYKNRIVNSEEYFEFAKHFNNNLEAFHTELHEIASTSKKVDVDELMDTTSDILSLASNSLQVFDILHNLRHYDDSTYAHSLNVSIICNVFGKWLQYSQEDLKLLTVAGLLHDIGKLSIDPKIIKKPGKLTDEEFAIIKQHPVLGFNLLKKKGVDSRILSAALMHHKKCDGSGYPNLPPSVPLTDFAKIVTIADIYEAMTANRVYRQGLCPFDVIKMLQDGGFQLYEPKFLMVFLNGIVQSYLNHYVQLSNGQVGVIKYINQFSPPDPMIQLESGEIIDLSKDKSVRIIALM
ncbi:MAG: HD domain-containing protein [Lachnospiraceae bacterium]|nr:HD domain-containing protein [Lachnospiraceae bacterium]